MNEWPFGADDPYPAYHAARAQAPVQWNEQLDSLLITSFEHAHAVLRRSEQWSSDPRNNPRLRSAFGADSAIGGLLTSSLLMTDPPAHTRLRRAVNQFFTPRAMQRIADRVAAIVDMAFEPLADGEPIELMSELAYPIPLAVICELFDVGVEGAELLRVETPRLARMLEVDPSSEVLEAAGAASMALMLFLVPLIAERRVEPGEDLLSALIHPPDGGATLETDEIVAMCLLLLAAGHETTANLIGNAMLALLEHPDQLDWLHRHPELAAGAVEELLRYDSPAQLAARVALGDTQLGGVSVRAGEAATVVIGAANRDPARYPDPDRLLLSRDGPPHLAFGHGPHFCAGAGLARLEGAEALKHIAHSAPLLLGADHSHERDPSRTFRRLRSLQIAKPLPTGSAPISTIGA